MAEEQGWPARDADASAAEDGEWTRLIYIAWRMSRTASFNPDDVTRYAELAVGHRAALVWGMVNRYRLSLTRVNEFVAESRLVSAESQPLQDVKADPDLVLQVKVEPSSGGSSSASGELGPSVMRRDDIAVANQVDSGPPADMDKLVRTTVRRDEIAEANLAGTTGNLQRVFRGARGIRREPEGDAAEPVGGSQSQPPEDARPREGGQEEPNVALPEEVDEVGEDERPQPARVPLGSPNVALQVEAGEVAEDVSAQPTVTPPDSPSAGDMEARAEAAPPERKPCLCEPDPDADID